MLNRVRFNPHDQSLDEDPDYRLEHGTCQRVRRSASVIELVIAALFLIAIVSVLFVMPIPEDAPNPTLRLALEGHSLAVTGLAFSPDGRMLASASLDKTVAI